MGVVGDDMIQIVDVDGTLIWIPDQNDREQITAWA